MKIRMLERYRVVVSDRYLKVRFVEELVSIRYDEHSLICTDLGLQLLEGERAAVTYVPLEGVDGAVLHPNDTRFTCRWNGEAR